MYSKKILLVLVFILVAFYGNAQDCNLRVIGKVTDKATGLPLPYAYVILQEKATGTATDDNGAFKITNLCEGEYHLILSHIGCESRRIHIELTNDTVLNIAMTHTALNLVDVTITGTRNDDINQPKLTINRQVIEDNTDKSLSGIIENETGVHLIKTGSGIAKPVIHGLYGNRLIILNNGLAQSGQQWGNGHSPEIDPFAADKITVLKGASALEYSGGNLGSTILVEPEKIDKEPHLHGQLNYIFETNGRGHNANLRLEKYSSKIAWKWSGTVKKYGDKKSANYFLRNTGVEEANFSLQLEKSIKDKTFLDLYFSSFNTRIGILRGSHIGNLTDLEEAFVKDEPFYTEPDFSYSLDAPKHHVSHHLIKSKLKHYFDDNQLVEVVLGGQLNDRKEFDVRRSGRSDIPALSLKQYSFNGDLIYTRDLKKKWQLKLGNQNNITDNTNNPETGILPLIPDYISFKTGLFNTLSKQYTKTDLDIGIRYDFEQQNVVSISNSAPREIIRYKNNFNNVGSVIGLKHNFSKTKSCNINTGFASRNPAVNELYSSGLHQGVSGIEEGDSELETENSLKSSLEFNWVPTTKFTVNTLVYYQWFNDYIFLNPTDEIRLTIRGAFPVFKYEQTDATIYGLDLSTQFTINGSLHGLLKYSFIRGDDKENNIPLAYIPPDNIFGSLTYRASKAVKLTKQIKLEAVDIELNNKFVFEQSDVLEEQDFVKPPPSYNLLGLKISTNVIAPNIKFRLFTKATNLLNIEYRDYMNRWRYFADDSGISVSVGVNFKF